MHHQIKRRIEIAVGKLQRDRSYVQLRVIGPDQIRVAETEWEHVTYSEEFVLREERVVEDCCSSYGPHTSSVGPALTSHERF